MIFLTQKGKPMSKAISEKRSLCLQYIQDNYDEWPKPYSTWHTARCHHGYSWHQEQLESPWVLVHYDTKDVISEEDVQNYRAPTPPASELWVLFNEQAQIIDFSTEKKELTDGWVKYTQNQK